MSIVADAGIFMVVRDEQQFIERNILYHASLGVRAFSVVDHCSTDATTEILRRLEYLPGLSWFRHDDPVFDHGRLANWALRNLLRESAPRWVFALDADEFLCFSPDLPCFIEQMEKIGCQYGTIPWIIGVSTAGGQARHPCESPVFFKPWPERAWQHDGHLRKAFAMAVPGIEVVVGGHYFTSAPSGSNFPRRPRFVPAQDAYIAHYEFRDRASSLYAKWKRLAEFERDSSSTPDAPWLERLEALRQYVRDWEAAPLATEKFWRESLRTFWGTPVPPGRVIQSSKVRNTLRDLDIQCDHLWLEPDSHGC